jgi:hypothetical protein
VEIKITCRSCDRTYPLAMVLDPESKPGHCPFCGEVLAFQYTPTFVGVADKVIGLGAEFVRQLTLLGELAGGYRIEGDSITVPVANAIAAQEPRVREPYRSGWPPRTGEPVS